MKWLITIDLPFPAFRCTLLVFCSIDPNCFVLRFCCIISFLHSLHIVLTYLSMWVHYGLGVIFATNDHPEFLLNLERCLPWFVNILRRKVFELRKPLSDVVTIGISFFTKCDGTVTSKVLVEMCSARKPLHEMQSTTREKNRCLETT